jgi:hypothetical protein
MTNAECGAILEAQTYKFAKSMPKHPHYYTLRTTWESDQLFQDVVTHMRSNAVTEYFYTRPMLYFHWNGMKYWTMGNPLEVTKLINRAEANSTYQ